MKVRELKNINELSSEDACIDQQKILASTTTLETRYLDRHGCIIMSNRFFSSRFIDMYNSLCSWKSNGIIAKLRDNTSFSQMSGNDQPDSHRKHSRRLKSSDQRVNYDQNHLVWKKEKVEKSLRERTHVGYVNSSKSVVWSTNYLYKPNTSFCLIQRTSEISNGF